MCSEPARGILTGHCRLGEAACRLFAKAEVGSPNEALLSNQGYDRVRCRC